MAITLGTPSRNTGRPNRVARGGLDSLRHGSDLRLTPARTDADVTYEGDAPLFTVAPTGAGKGVSVIIPTLLSYPGSVVVIDPKGENYAVTSRYRRQIGQKVYKIDPFGVAAGDPSSINPFDIFELDGASIEADAAVIAELIASGKTSQRDPFWDISGQALLSGMIAYVSRLSGPERTIGHMRALMHRQSFTYDVKDWVGDESCPAYAREELGAYAGLPESGVRPSVLGVANSYLKVFAGEDTQKSVGQGGVPLRPLIDGVAQSVYLIVPPDKLKSHGSLVRVWVGVLMRALMSRGRGRVRPKVATLFLLDECAQLGNFPLLESVVTLGRGYGIQAWMFWQDFAQVRSLYPQEAWKTLINNCEVVQMFGARNHLVKREFCELLGVDVQEVAAIATSEQILVMDGGRAIRAGKLNYLREAKFQDRRDPHPFHNESEVSGPRRVE